VGEAEARDWLVRRFNVPRETLSRLDAFVRILRDENDRQNLVSQSSLNHLWARHIVDSAQLLPLVPPSAGRWVDLGSGAGFPGLIVGLLRAGPATLIEQRRLRVEFLQRAVDLLGLADRVEIRAANVSQAKLPPFDVISARAFAPLERTFAVASHLAHSETVWVLPRGRNAQSELEAARASWQGSFRLERSVTDDEAWIVVAGDVRRRKKGKSVR
jgi:16S rRNA (guanine527-N7)-methyltransferase